LLQQLNKASIFAEGISQKYKYLPVIHTEWEELSTGDKPKGLNAFMRNRLRIIRVNLLRFLGLTVPLQSASL